MGVRVSETKPEIRIATTMVTENSCSRRPTMPPMNSTGMNTATSEKVMERIVKPISRAAFTAAVRRGSPISMWRTIFSSMTMASSTTKPTDRVSAITAHRQAHRQPALIREPFGHHRNRRGIAEPVAQSANHPETDEQVRQAGRIRTQKESQADQNPSRQRTVERAYFVLDAPGHDKGEGEHRHRNREHHGSVGALPAKLFLQGSYEHAPRIKSAKGQVHREPTHSPPPPADPDCGALSLISLHGAACHG